MAREYKVSFNNNTITVDENTTYKEVSDIFKDQFDYDIILCMSNKSFVNLCDTIKKDCEVEFYDRSSLVGSSVYNRSARFILLLAVNNVLGEQAKLICHHSQDNGIFCTIEDAYINQDILDNIENEMFNIVNSDYKFEKLVVSRMDAIKYFKQNEQYDKVNVLKYISNTYINLYRLNHTVGYFYGKMAYSTKSINKFKLYFIKDNGFVMQLPDTFNPEVVLDYKHHEKVFEKFLEYTKWGRELNVKNAADLNKVVSSGHIEDLISLAEVYFNRELSSLSEKIDKANVKMVLIAGPSSSGKTTVAKRLAVHLKSLGYNPHSISIDNYFLDISDRKKDKYGNYNFEGLDIVDVELFNKHMNKLLNKERVLLPSFNFVTGKREYKDNWLKLNDNDIIIIEGLHALNDALTLTVNREDKYKIYISPLTQINIDNYTHVHTSDVRKLRRIIRDKKRKGSCAEDILKMWSNIQLGEVNNIFPYQDDVDSVINSALIYEIGVLKTYVEPLLFNVSENSEEYAESLRLINFLRNFLPIPADTIPSDSILREFIGGSSFD